MKAVVKVVTEVLDSQDNEVYAVKLMSDGTYSVYSDGVERHHPCDAEAAMRALGHYLNSHVYKEEKAGIL